MSLSRVHRITGLAGESSGGTGERVPVPAKGWLPARLAGKTGLAGGSWLSGKALLAARVLLVVKAVKCPELLLPAGS